MINPANLLASTEALLGIKLKPDAGENLVRLATDLTRDPEMQDIRWIAYALATVLRECGVRFAPIAEWGHLAYFDKYEPRTPIGIRLGNTVKGDGYLYRGRGFCMITGRPNYEKFSPIVGVDLIANPDAALEYPHAYKILTVGMVRGMFTGVGLPKYINETCCDLLGSRAIINGKDHAEEIAANAVKLQRVLEQSELSFA